MPEFKLKITADAKQFGDEVRGVVNELNQALPGEVTGVLGKLSGALASPVGAIAARASALAGLFQFSITKAATLQKIAQGAELSTTQAQALTLAANRFGVEPEALLSQLE